VPAIFISYRRDDNSGYAGRLTDGLRGCFGDDQVFRDCDDIAKGTSFEEEIRDALRSASVLLLLIGPRWLTLSDDAGRPRIEGAGDYVRLEIEAALRSGLPIIPLLLPGARMPTGEELPRSIGALTFRQAYALRDDRWWDDLRELVRQIEIVGDLLARCPEGRISAGRPAHPALVAVVHFLPDFFSGLGQPAGLLIKRNLGRKSDLLYAGVFLCLAVLVAEVLIVLGLKEPESSSFVRSYAAAVAFWGTFLVLLSGPLWLAWWLVGARRHYRKVLINSTYQVAFSCVQMFLAAAVCYTGLKLSDPQVVEDLYGIMREALSGQGTERVMTRLGSVPKGTATFIAFGLGIVIQAWWILWLFRSWGAYRLVLEKTRVQSLLAFCLFSALTAGLPSLSIWLASPQAAG
jgi:hypothetical protein